MKLTTVVVSLDPSQSAMQQAAYQLRMDNGRAEAHDFEFWWLRKDALPSAGSPRQVVPSRA